ncbi:hypothetical protein SAMN06265795_101110 [Noviherbaspirillum humi]|uniref:Uncharacterized protein n=1 Tax=Noviherbaspirillum humi TaxID=1688639 RepID=A0A239BV98_9BURK|nr:hypothetical protein [Noviherbaspirillum humi]SNS11965.1 hypothetical protein SAMN06265795_101110 [Noviherbaspirillum humi]
MMSQSLRSRYRTEAVIDWIQLDVRTTQPTQPRWIWENLQRITGTNATRTEAINPGAGGVATNFRITLYDAQANSYSELRRIVSALPLAQEPTVTGLEISLDFYARPEDGDPNAVTEMVRRLQAGIAAYGKDARQFDPSLKDTATMGNVFLSGDDPEPTIYTRRLKIDPHHNLRIGSKGNQISYQVYYKRTDGNWGGDSGNRDLPIAEHRARAEFTLRGDELAKHGIVRLDDLDGYRFQRLAELLHFRRLRSIDELTQGRLEIMQLMQLMLVAARKGRAEAVCTYPLGRLAYGTDARTGKPRDGGKPKELRHSRHTVADEELNRIVRAKLATLSTRFHKK